ncbi:PucR family transcriptional regulator ligand-binding domain-containing protein [Saccharopolyspora sp. NPDC050389]|uniref:PucR family transcriptional regulator n=1 Tax=Saccharopolyspora sp. NPDC050389 TaxID=3155516 RepID=UPI0033D10812
MGSPAHALTVADVVALDRLHLAVAHAGSGMRAVVDAPHVAELPSPGQWLEGGELVMTTGMLLGHDAQAWSHYISELDARGVAALVVGVGPHAPFAEAPDMLVDLAREHDLPLLTAPATTSFVSITRAIIAAQAESERTILQDSFAMQVRLTGIVARGGSVDNLLVEWHRSTGEGAGVLDRVGRVLGKNAGLAAEALEAVSAKVREAPPALGDRLCLPANEIPGSDAELVVSPFSGETTVRGYVVRTDSQLSKAELAVPTLLSLLALEFERRWFLDEPARRRRAQHFANLLSIDDDGRARALLKGLGVEARNLWGIAVEAKSDTHAEVLVDDLAVVLGTPLLRQRDRLVEGLATGEPKRILQEYGLDVPVGIGTAVSPGGASRTMRQATSALATSRRTGSMIEFVDGAAHEFLLNVADTDYLSAFAGAVLAPIEATGNGEVLLRTLHTWLIERRSIEACAERMGVHRHTVRNRIHRITQLTGHSLENVDAQTELWLALKARGFRED